MKNPLLEKFNTIYSSTPFSKIKNEHFKPAFIEGIKIAKEEIDKITTNKSVPTFVSPALKLHNRYCHNQELVETCY